MSSSRSSRGADRNREVPLRITYTMSSPVIYSGQPIHLDSLLAFVVQRGGGRFGHDEEPPPDYWVRLPLAVMEHDGHRWYRGSAWWPGIDEESSRQRWAGKWDRDHEHWIDTSKAKTVTLTNGPLKESFVPMQAVTVPEIVFYAVGDFVHVRQLARRVLAIGKKASQGYGRVSKCLIQRVTEDVDGDWDLDWIADDGCPARNVPASFWREHVGEPQWVDRQPISVPYWRKLDVSTVDIAGIAR